MELHKLNSIQHVLEKSVSTTLGHLKDVQYHQDITETFKKFDEERKTERKTLQEKIDETLELLKNKTDLLKENRIAEITDFRKFKMEMIAIQENIQNLRAGAKMKLELLKKEYVEIAEDVDYYTEMVPSWSEVKKDHAFVGGMKKSLSRKGPACKEAKDFMEFVHKSNGHENGWRKEDHQLFLKYRKKFKNSDETARELHETLPDLSIEDINRHEEWYKQYLTLQKRKKDAIREWKKSKNKSNGKPVSMDVTGGQEVVSRVQNPEEVRKKLAQWKLEKQQQQIKVNREIQRIEEQRRKELEMQQHRRAEELKRLVDEWKTTRTVLEQQETERKKRHAEKEKRRRAAEANRMIRQFQSQDDLYISKMLNQRRREEAAKPSRSKSSQTTKRDPQRLLKPTRQWINRVHDDNVYSNECSVTPLRSIPKLSVPEWRRTVQ